MNLRREVIQYDYFITFGIPPRRQSGVPKSDWLIAREKIIESTEATSEMQNKARLKTHIHFAMDTVSSGFFAICRTPLASNPKDENDVTISI